MLFYNCRYTFFCLQFTSSAPNCISHSLAHTHKHSLCVLRCVFLRSKITRFSDVYRSVFCLCLYYLPVVESYVSKRVRERQRKEHAFMQICTVARSSQPCLGVCVFGIWSGVVFNILINYFTAHVTFFHIFIFIFCIFSLSHTLSFSLFLPLLVLIMAFISYVFFVGAFNVQRLLFLLLCFFGENVIPFTRIALNAL